MEYKLNKYLYKSTRDDIVVINNLLNGKIFALTQEKYGLLNTKELDTLKDTYPVFFSAMEKLGVIIPSNLNEVNQVKMQNRQMIFDTRGYRITINPTLECNFNCWYCYEQHTAGKMGRAVMKSILKHIEREIKEKSLRHVELDWFGGEPLLYFNEIVYPIAKKAKKISQKNNVLFTSTMTTNGYLMNFGMINKFKEIGLNNFQITLDGDETTHNKIRFGKNKEGSFQKIIENINLLAENPDNIISVRINYTAKTLEKISGVVDLFPIKERISICFQQVWQDSVRQQISAEEHKKIFEQNGLQIFKHQLNTKGYVCYADKLQQAVINFDGRVFKCTARDFCNTKADGLLLPTGEVQWDMALISKRFGNATFENEFCMNCKFLPACMGPCSQKMMEFTKDRDFKAICLEGGVQKTLEEYADDFYEKLNKK